MAKIDDENFTHSIELIGGYTDKSGAKHRRVTFGKRIIVQELLNLENNPLAQSATQFQFLIARIAITGFGDLPMIDKKTGKRKFVELSQLVALDSIDSEDLINGNSEFLRLSRGERVAQLLDETQTALAFGVEIGETHYDLITFGRRLTGYDLVEADRLGLTGIARACFEIARQIEKMASSETGAEINAPISPDVFYSMDGEDFNVLRAGCELWRQSFRRPRAEVSEKRVRKTRVSAGERNGLDGIGDSESAERAH